MPSLHYLDDNQDSLYAIKNIGSTFSDAIIGMAQMKARQREIAQRQFVEQEYLKLAQQKSAMDALKFTRESDTDKQYLDIAKQNATSMAGEREAMAQQHKASAASSQEEMSRAGTIGRLGTQQRLGPQGILDLVKDQRPDASGANTGAGPQLFSDLRSAGAVPQGGFDINPQELMNRIIAARAGLLMGEAATSPTAAAGLTKPVSFGPNRDVFDQPSFGPGATPMMRTPPPAMSDYQGGMLEEKRREFDTGEERRTTQYGENKDYKERSLQDRIRHETALENKSKTPGRFSGIGQSQPGASFDSEQAARQAGKKKGDIIYLKGVGKVQLN
jgi:hypothetical protein